MGETLFFAILISIVIGNVLWWRHAHLTARTFRRPRAWQFFFGLWGGLMSVSMVLVVVSRVVGGQILIVIPQRWMAVVYLWHVLFVLIWLVWRVVVFLPRQLQRLIKSARVETVDPPAIPPSVQNADSPIARDTLETPIALDAQVAPPPTRRQFLAAASLTVPPTLATLAGWYSVSRFDEFRTRRITLQIPNLPAPLEGLKIAHVSDIHIGKFTDDPMLRAIVERTNAMRADLILFNGDLIDWDIADLPAGLKLLQNLDPKTGLCMCEGNHDLLSGRWDFERSVTAAGFPMPINDSLFFTVRGQPIQIMCLRWGGPVTTDMSLENDEADIRASTRELVATRREGAFPILLAHHPHAFDYAGPEIPLTLSGHTHGGQIRLGRIAPASVRFRYLSGLYRSGNQQLFVSNGVGNWFPLRVGAPAEIGEITLRRA